MLNTLGTNAVAAYTAAGRIDQLATLPSASFGVADGSVCRAESRCQGVRSNSPRRCIKLLLVNVGLSLVLGALIIVFSKPLVNLFLGPNQPAVTALAKRISTTMPACIGC